jgi:hypothetical protein
MTLRCSLWIMVLTVAMGGRRSCYRQRERPSGHCFDGHALTSLLTYFADTAGSRMHRKAASDMVIVADQLLHGSITHSLPWGMYALQREGRFSNYDDPDLRSRVPVLVDLQELR